MFSKSQLYALKFVQELNETHLKLNNAVSEEEAVAWILDWVLVCRTVEKRKRPRHLSLSR